MRLYFWFVTALLLSACAGKPVQTINAVTPLSDLEYNELVKKNTASAEKYKGFYATFQADITILTNEFKAAELKQRGAFLQWDEKQYQSERDKAVQDASAYSKFFMRFFSPERDYDDFAKGKTIWKVYLEYNGTRFEGTVKKLTEKMIEIQTLYPYFDRFSTPYEIAFSVPMSTIETGESKLILSSSLGQAEFNFPVRKR